MDSIQAVHLLADALLCSQSAARHGWSGGSIVSGFTSSVVVGVSGDQWALVRCVAAFGATLYTVFP